jgi:hypothetical protein
LWRFPETECAGETIDIVRLLCDRHVGVAEHAGASRSRDLVQPN